MEKGKKEEAEIISFEDLSSSIGDKDSGKEKQKSEKDLEDSLSGKKDNSNPLIEAKEEEGEDTPDTPEVGDEIDDTPEKTESPNKDESLEEEEEQKAKKEEEEEDPIPDSEESSFYKKALLELFGEEVSTLTIIGEGGEEVETDLADIDMTLEMFKEIVQIKIDSIKEEASKDKISVKNTSDFTRQLIEIENEGGNISEALKVKQSFSDPLDNLDLDTKEGQREAVFLRLKASQVEDDIIKRTIKSYEEEGILDKKATEAEGELREAIKGKLESEKERAKEVKKKKVELLKEYKKELKDNLSKFELKETIKSKIVDIATKKDDEDRFEIDKIYSEVRRDPEKAARLSLFLLDEDEYISQVTSQKLREEKLERSKKLKITGKGAPNPTYTKKKKQEKNVVLFEELE